MQITYFVQALFVAVALAAPAPQGGDDLPSGIFPSGDFPTGTRGPIPTGGPIPAGTGGGPVPTGGFPSHTGGGGHYHHTRTRGGDGPDPTSSPAGADERDDESSQ
ncbi:hypothetical protein VE04_04844 [Pseudogymnoascus sp. 24MN13]|nr:hypothetical protein VE04_04844 [Pseudogymnoascus sp. 24MN13]